ncbi:hypothetical protein NKG94_13515 [Micromonospora sp. M12]
MLTTGLMTAAISVASSTGAQAAVNTSANYLVVYNNNIENWLPSSCSDGYNWDRLITYLKGRPLSPDIFTVQQVSNQTQLDTLTRRLSDELPGTYAGQIAIANPGSMGYTSTCGKLKNQQTNAVVYRTDRFTFEDATRWRSDARRTTTPAPAGARTSSPPAAARTASTTSPSGCTTTSATRTCRWPRSTGRPTPGTARSVRTRTSRRPTRRWTAWAAA